MFFHLIESVFWIFLFFLCSAYRLSNIMKESCHLHQETFMLIFICKNICHSFHCHTSMNKNTSFCMPYRILSCGCQILDYFLHTKNFCNLEGNHMFKRLISLFHKMLTAKSACKLFQHSFFRNIFEEFSCSAD